MENKKEIQVKAADEVVNKLRSKRDPTPYFLLIITTASMFFVEAAEMFIFTLLPPIPANAVVLLDASILTILIFPILYFYFFKPMTLNIAELEQKEKALRESEEKLKKYSENLEEIVEEKSKQVIQMEKLSSLGELMGGYSTSDKQPVSWGGQLFPTGFKEYGHRSSLKRGRGDYKKSGNRVPGHNKETFGIFKAI